MSTTSAPNSSSPIRHRNGRRSRRGFRIAKATAVPMRPWMPPDAPTEIVVEKVALAMEPTTPEITKIAAVVQAP
jgi:hypothetical protein